MTVHDIVSNDTLYVVLLFTINFVISSSLSSALSLNGSFKALLLLVVVPVSS